MHDIAVKKGGLTNRAADIVVNDYLNAELLGKKTHGIEKFCRECNTFKERRGSPKIICDNGSVILIDANKEIGQLAADFCTSLAIRRAKKYGISIIAMSNSQRYGVLGTWVRKIAQSNLVGLIMNSSEPAAVPYGNASKILGTNPIAFGIPTTGDPLVFDMATSKCAMSNIGLSIYENKKLPKSSFFDVKGKYTTNPRKAYAVEIFGGYKGLGLSLAIEVMSGSMISAKMGKKIKSPYDIGYYFQAIDPTIFTDITKFKKVNTEFIKQLKTSPRKSQLVIPGEISEKKKKFGLKAGTLEISNLLYRSLIKLGDSYED